MRPVSPQWAPTIAAAHRIALRIESWREGNLLAKSVPVLEGAVTMDDTAILKRRLQLTVPAATPDGTSWDPGDSSTHPLAAYGQRLRVLAGIELPSGTIELLELGWYLITGWERDETAGTITVAGQDLAVLLEDARHYREESPPAGTTYATEFVRLAAGILPTRIEPGLANRTVSSQTVWDRDRTKNLTDLCKAWQARWYVADDGVLVAAPAYPDVTAATTPVLRLVSGRAGTVITRTRRGDRTTLYNAVVATGKAIEGGEAAPYGIAEITDPTSPIRVQGPYGRRPRFYASELLTTSVQCTEAAVTLLTAASSVSRMEPVEISPDPAIQLGDVVEIVTGGHAFKGRVSTLSLPLTVGGAMTVTVATKPSENDEGSP